MSVIQSTVSQSTVDLNMLMDIIETVFDRPSINTFVLMSGDRGQPTRVPFDEFDEGDPGLARERTDLAWTRSAIAFLAVGIAILKVEPAAGIPILAIAGVIWVCGGGARIVGHRIASRRVLLVTASVNALAVVSLVLTLAGPSSHGLRP